MKAKTDADADAEAKGELRLKVRLKIRLFKVRPKRGHKLASRVRCHSTRVHFIAQA